MDIYKFTKQQRELLELEKEAQEEQASSGKQSKLVQVVEVESGLSGLSEVKLSLKPSKQHHVQFKSGESITLKTQESEDLKNTKPVKGVISVVTDKFVHASMDEFLEEWWEHKVLLSKVPDEVTHRRMMDVLQQLEKIDAKSCAKQIVSVAFGSSKPQMVEEEVTKNLKFFDNSLNESQKEAVKFALRTKDIALVLGPPGTGKTTTV